jgi:DNA-binding GntR family transcriptional regulator
MIGPVAGAKTGQARELLADRAYVELRDRIVTLQIAPGAPIDEDLLGRELEMGRTPVREAI